MKPSFEKIILHCSQFSNISRQVFDEFLMNYTAERENLDRFFIKQESKYSHVLSEWQESNLNYLKAEYIASRLFQEGGLLPKYRKHSALKLLSVEENEWLDYVMVNPWRFSLARIIDKPAEDFYTMFDEFNEETYLLYSPGITRTTEEVESSLWFMLISNNGMCFQTFGLIIPLGNFTSDDVFSYGIHVNDDILDEQDLYNDIEKNPFPYFMLLNKGNTPSIISKDKLIEYVNDIDQVMFDPNKLNKRFEVQEVDGYYKIAYIKVKDFPNYGIAYYDSHDHLLYRGALNFEAFEILTNELNKFGLNLDSDNSVICSFGMKEAIESILNQKISTAPFVDLFESDEMDEAQTHGAPKSKVDKNSNKRSDPSLIRLNELIGEMVAFINNSKKPPLEELAHKFNVDPETVKKYYETLLQSVGKSSDEMK